MNRLELNDHKYHHSEAISSDIAIKIIIKTIYALAIIGVLTRCGNDAGELDEQKKEEVPQSTQKKYPDIIVGIDNETHITYMSLGLFNAKRNYVFTVTSNDDPDETFTFNTDISDRGFDGFEYRFSNPTSGFTLSATTDDVPPTDVMIRGLCYGDFDKCIRGFDTYP